ncbi:MAG: AtpZ/AtpI family protein [Erysipelotrichaceae bacterium]|nr:AtpZ/AtpI family protein [Erysipelotrichaceae bacterium]MDY5252402.1 AtpZ/AtpI family protein [Erysipelotrichaceae bacterium]
MKDIAKFLQMGIVIALCILFGLYIGYLFDTWLKFAIMGKLVGLLIGAILSLMYLWKLGKYGA